MNDYKLEGPAVVSFSGGRTSAYLLRMVLDANGGSLPPDVFAVFADTGKERPETLDFVAHCQRAWDVDIHTVCRPGKFGQLIKDKRYLPNPVARFCTSDLKVKPIADFMTSRGFDFWTMVVGIRADEPARVARMRDKTTPQFDYSLPLASAGIQEADVMSFWADQSFDLALRQGEGNCDLCFMKGQRTLLRLISDCPSRADWWVEQEDEIGSTFRSGLSYSRLQSIGRNMRRQLPLFDEEPMGSCFCGD